MQIEISCRHQKLLDVTVADSFVTRLNGLLLHKSLGPDCGLLLDNCNSVHTIGMSFPIDVIFLDGRKKIIGIRENIQPRRIAYCSGAKSVLECNAGFVTATRLSIGQVLEW